MSELKREVTLKSNGINNSQHNTLYNLFNELNICIGDNGHECSSIFNTITQGKKYSMIFSHIILNMQSNINGVYKGTISGFLYGNNYYIDQEGKNKNEVRKRLIMRFFKDIVRNIRETEPIDIGSIYEAFDVYNQLCYPSRTASIHKQFKNCQQIKYTKIDTGYRATLDFEYETKIQLNADDFVKQRAKEKVMEVFMLWYNNTFVPQNSVRAIGQMEDTSAAVESAAITGGTPLIADVSKETVITSDVPAVSTLDLTPLPALLRTTAAASIISEFSDLTGRWLQFDNLRLTRDEGNYERPWKSYNLVEDLFPLLNNPVMLPFKQYLLFCPTEMEIKIKFNSNKFNQGRLVVSYLNDAQQMQVGDLQSDDSAWLSYRSIKQALQRDHVMVDLNSSNEVTIKIPFLSPKQFVPNFNSTLEKPFNSAALDIHVLSPLKVPDESQSFVGGVIYVKFNQISFTALVPARNTIESIRAYPQGPTLDMQARNPLLIGLGVGLLGSLLKPIAGSLGNGITGLLQGVPVIGGLFKSSPVLGPLRPERYDGGEKAFVNLGQFLNADKPADHKQPSELRPNALGDMSIGIKTQPQLSMRLDCTALTPQFSLLFPSAPVQSISELTSIWSLLDTFEWTAAQQTVGESIYNIPTNINYWKYDETILGYFRDMFSMYAGSLEFRFDIIGTELHTGALSFGFIPFTGSFTMEESKSSFYKLYDLREERQVTFDIPYIDTVMLRTTAQAQSYGSLRVFVQNPLVPVSTVTPSVTIKVFVRAAPDFHYSFLQEDPTILAIGQMDTGDNDQTEPGQDFAILKNHGINANIAEDHELLHDIIKRYVKYTSGSTDGSNKSYVDLTLSQAEFLRTNSANILFNFRFVRGSYTLTLLFSRKPTTRLLKINNREVAIIPMQQASNNSISNVPAPCSIGSIVQPEITTFGNGIILDPLQSTFELDYTETPPMENYMWDSNTPSGSERGVVTYPTNSSVPPLRKTVVNSIFKPITDDGVENVAAINNNNAALTVFQGNAALVSRETSTFAKNVKDTMDTNTCINEFNNTVQATTNQINTKVQNALSTMNTNSTATNTNNANIVAAIDEGSGEIVSAETPIQIKVHFTYYNAVNRSFSGEPAQIVLTNVNQSVKINVPYYSLYNYQDHHYQLDFAREGHVRSLGRLAIESSQPVNYDIFWSAGDDFYMSKFIGISRKSIPEVRAMPQMDIAQNLIVEATAPKVTNFFKSVSSGVSNSVASVGEGVTNNLVNPVKGFVSTVAKYDKLADTASDVLTTVKEIADNIMNFLLDKFKWLTSGGALYSSIIHLVQSFINPTLPSICLSIGGILINIGFTTMEFAVKIFSVIQGALRKFKPQTVTSEEQHTDVRADGQCDHECFRCSNSVDCHPQCASCDKQRSLFDRDTIATLSGLILSSISTACGLKTSLKADGLFVGLFKMSGHFWTSVNGSVKFLKDLIRVFERAYRWILRRSDESRIALTLAENGPDIQALVREMNELQMPMNEPAVSKNPEQKRRFWLTVTKAHTLVAELVGSNQPEKRILIQQCDKFIKYANQIGNKALNCPVRYEPFVIGLKGKSKLGKSFLLNHLLPDILAEVYGYRSYTAPVYTRTTGTEYWNGYTEQPAILYDDFLAVTEPTICSRQIAELYGLKSSAIFNCNMAALEDKERNANPFLVALAMNKVIVPNGVTEPDAFLRRKDTFWEAVPFIPDSKKDIPDQWTRDWFTKEEVEQFGHLRFYRFEEVITEKVRRGPFTYAEFKSRVMEECRKYHEQEKQNVQARFDKLRVTLPEVARTMTINADPFSIFYASCMMAADLAPVQTGDLPNRAIFNQLTLLNNVAFDNAQNEMNRPGPSHAAGQMDNEAGGHRLSDETPPGAPYPRREPYYHKWKREVIEFLKRLPRRLFNLLLKADQLGQTRIEQICDPVFGHCLGCMDANKQLFLSCTNAVEKHGYCRPCYTQARTHNVALIDACTIDGTVYQQHLEPSVVEVFKLMKQLARRGINGAQKVLSDPKFYYALGAGGYVVMHIYLVKSLAENQAQDEYRVQQFYHNVFQKEFLGGIDSKYGFCFYNPHKYAEEGKKGSYMFPYTTRNRLGVDEWTYVRTTSDTPYGYEFDDPYCREAIFAKAKGQMDIVPELVEGIEVYWHDPPPLRARPTGPCEHKKLQESLEEYDYYYDYSKGLGWFEDNERNLIPDAQCGNDCDFLQYRQQVIRKLIEEHSTSYLQQLARLKRNPDFKPDTIPRELLCPTYINETSDGLKKVLAQLQEHQKLSLWDRLVGVFARMAKVIAVGTALVVSVTTILGACKFIYEYICPKSEATDDIAADAQLTSSGDFKTLKMKRDKNKPRTMIAAVGQGNGEHKDMAVNKISTNTMVLSLKFVDADGKLKNPLFRTLGLYNRTAILCQHEAKFILYTIRDCQERGAECTLTLRPFTNRGNSLAKEMEHPIELKPESLKFIKGDLVFWDVPPRFPQFKDITNLIASRAQHSCEYSEMQMIACDTRSTSIVKNNVRCFGVAKKVTTIASEAVEEIYTYDAYVTDYTGAGFCGSIAIVGSNNPIMCYHFAGNDKEHRGYAIPLVREEIVKFRNGSIPYDYYIPILATGQASIPLDGEYWSLGVVDKKLTPFLSSESKIIPSVIQGKIADTEVLTQPGILSGKDPRYHFDYSPLKWGCDKHLRPPLDLPKSLIEAAFHDARDMILTNCKPLRSTLEKLSIQEAIVGFENLDFYDPIKLDTSSGYPYNLNKNGSKKSSLIQVDRNNHGMVTNVRVHKSLVEDIESNNEMRERGIRPFTIFQDTLKDERRKQRKLLMKDGTRVFSQSPVDFTISTRQYCLDFSASFMKYRHQTEHAVGINVNSKEWTSVAHRLLAKGNNIVSGDFTDYGPRIWYSLVKAAGKIISDWYSHFYTDEPIEDRRAREVIVEEIATTYHICNNHIYMVYCGIPSGHALTTVLNSLVHILLIRVCWMGVTGEDLETMKKNIAFVCYGDDHLISVSNDYRDNFNCQSISDYLAKFDFKYTDSKKEGNTKYTKLKDAEFLKCGFKAHPTIPNIFLAPLDTTSVTECAQWIFKCSDLKLATRENAEASIRNAFGHGPTFFNEWKRKVNDALKDAGIDPVVITWEHLNNMFFPEEYQYSMDGFRLVTHETDYLVDYENDFLEVKLNPFTQQDQELIEDDYFTPEARWAPFHMNQ